MPMPKQLKMMQVILHLYNRARQLVYASIPISRVAEALSHIHISVMEVNRMSPARFIGRGGRIPPPPQSLKN